jgi:hypothetical protein
MLGTVKGLCFNFIFVFASLRVESLLLFSAENGLHSPRSAFLAEDPRHCVKSFLRLRGGSETRVDEPSGKFLTFKIRCSNTKWGQSGNIDMIGFLRLCLSLNRICVQSGLWALQKLFTTGALP